MEGVETNPAKLKDVKLEENEEAVLGSDSPKETSKDVPMLGLEQSTGTDDKPENVRMEENKGVVPDSKCTERTSGDRSTIGSGQVFNANEGPQEVKMEDM